MSSSDTFPSTAESQALCERLHPPDGLGEGPTGPGEPPLADPLLQRDMHERQEGAAGGLELPQPVEQLERGPAAEREGGRVGGVRKQAPSRRTGPAFTW